MARMDLGVSAPEPYGFVRQAQAAVDKGPLDSTVRELVKIRVSQVNGCVFCVDMHVREARRLGERQDRLDQLPVWRESELFTERERAALVYAETVTREVQVEDDLWERVCKQFDDETERGHLVLQTALINTLNRLAVPLTMRPARREA
ncbi:carboxymuconolactone decarboxylase family protein [Streptomyces sp. AJS327]|uniref:carboxymuconolactone decarboxylase family protein n=1 Tax=Streptomyces sp. AJS327 TaxID=2545265 RepID=UPI0015DF4D36|nr:carboxymuconolactone decarboxylase family protein [Streptomyces sp. AJS327]MBA0051255.1 carboxymuconolactone decarboxylase family protein [Streptomyces sp. AJS327]